MDDGVSYTYWTFGDSVPGPMLRVRQGDTVELTLKNAADSKLTHSIDLHAVTGPIQIVALQHVRSGHGSVLHEFREPDRIARID